MESLQKRIKRVIIHPPGKQLRKLQQNLRSEEGIRYKNRGIQQPREFIEVDSIKIPKKLGNGLQFYELLPFDELYTTYKDHHRLTVFVNKGLKCVHPNCNKTAIYLIVTLARDGGRHVDLYDKSFELMNVDHIIPKSKGGSDHLSNKQPMCESHNTFKGSKLVPY